jgi:hypothetical protein
MISAVLAAAVITFSVPQPPKLDVERMLDAIAGVENWDGRTPGAAGEWGPWQMTPAVWKHCRGTLHKTLQQATPSELRTAAREELHFRMATLEINHHKLTAFLVGLSWTAGVKATLSNTATDAKREYAKRVEAIYESSK